MIPISISYFGLKLANYSIMLWIPIYSSEELDFSDGQKAAIAILYDIGTIIGCFGFGFLSDWFYAKRAPVCFAGLLLATVFHTFLVFVDNNIMLLIVIFVLGVLTGGISGVICGAMCADLAKRPELKSEESIATVSGIVDGTGSLGAALGQLGIGYLQALGWHWVFAILAIFVFLSSLPLIPMAYKEMKEIKEIRLRKRNK